MKIEIEDNLYLELPNILKHQDRLIIEGKEYIVGIGKDNETDDIAINLICLDNKENSSMKKLLKAGAGLRRIPLNENSPYYSRAYDLDKKDL